MDNTENMKDMERRVQLLYGVLSSPVDGDDYAEKARRVELRRFVFTQIQQTDTAICSCYS